MVSRVGEWEGCRIEGSGRSTTITRRKQKALTPPKESRSSKESARNELLLDNFDL